MPFGDADQVFHIGPASVAVPGMVQGLVEAHARFGRLPLTDLVGPRGRVGASRHRSVAAGRLSARDSHRHAHPYAAGTLGLCPEWAARVAGDRIEFPDLAETLIEIGRTGRQAMSADGWLSCRLRDDLTPRGGLLTHADFAAYRVIERAPVTTTYRGLEILTNPPPSAGGVLIAAALRQMERSGVAGDDADYYRAVAAAGIAANGHRAR